VSSHVADETFPYWQTYFSLSMFIYSFQLCVCYSIISSIFEKISAQNPYWEGRGRASPGPHHIIPHYQSPDFAPECSLKTCDVISDVVTSHRDDVISSVRDDDAKAWSTTTRPPCPWQPCPWQRCPWQRAVPSSWHVECCPRRGCTMTSQPVT